MNDHSPDRAGVLIVRLWVEADHPTASLRARITQTVGNTKGEHTVAVASSSDEICSIIRDWVVAFTDPDHVPGDGPVTATGDHQPS